MPGKINGKLQNFFLKYPLIRVGEGEVISRPTDSQRGVYYVLEGYVRMYIYFYDGKELTINIFKPGSYFSITSALSELPSNCYYKALTFAKLHYAESEDVLKFLRKNPDVLYELTTRISIGLQSMITNFTYMMNGSAFEKVVYVLVVLGKRFSNDKKGNKRKILLKLTHQDIASMANLSRETTSVELKNLDNEKVISYSGGIFVINDFDKLISYLQDFEEGYVQTDMKTV